MTGIVCSMVGASFTVAAAATVSTTSLSNVDWNWDQYYIFQLAYAGLDSSSRPVFMFGYKDTSTTYPEVMLFRVNSDLTITQGTPTSIVSTAVNPNVAATVDTDNNYGYCAYNKTTGGAYAKTFTIDKDNLSTGTPGSEATLYATTDGAMVSADYAGNGRVHYFHRRGGQLSGNYYSTRSGTTLTIGTEIIGYIGASTVYTQIRNFTYSGTRYRHVIISGNAGAQAAAVYWDNTTAATAGAATSITYSMGTGIKSHNLVRLKAADKFMIITSGSTAAQVVAGTVTWPTSGTTAPTISAGTPITLTDYPNGNMYGAIDGFQDDEAYVVYKKNSDSKFYWRKINSVGNTLYEHAANEILVLSSNSANAFVCQRAEAFGKKYMIGVVDNSTTTKPDVFVTELKTTYRTDDYASYLKLAVPFDSDTGTDDIAYKISGTGLSSSATKTQGANVALGTTQVKWTSSPNYVKAVDLTPGGAALTYTLPTSIPTSVSGTFVIEGWFRAEASGTKWCLSSADSGGRFIVSVSNATVANLTTSEGNQNFIYIGTAWTHVAFVCDGGTKRCYYDGIYKGAWVSGNTGFSTLHVGQFNSGDANDYDGQIQDFRVYVGTNKGYTGTNTGSANFTVPSSIIQSY